MDKEVPQSVYPDAVIARVRHWDGDSWELIQEHAEKRGESVNAFINRAIEETIQRDRGSAQ